MAPSILILKAGTKLGALADFPGDYEEWILRGMGLERSQGEVVAVAEGAPLPPPDHAAAVVITGSAAMVTDGTAWMVAAEEWLREATAQAAPILGICFGHQLLAKALGGEVGYNPKGVEVGTVVIRRTAAARSDPLFAGLPDAFPAQTTHRQTVVALPPAATLLATSALDGCQAFRWGERVWGIQFHPEFEAAMMPRYIEHYHARLLAEGKSPAALQLAVAPSPDAADLLGRFARLAGAAGRP